MWLSRVWLSLKSAQHIFTQYHHTSFQIKVCVVVVLSEISQYYQEHKGCEVVLYKSMWWYCEQLHVHVVLVCGKTWCAANAMPILARWWHCWGHNDLTNSRSGMSQNVMCCYKYNNNIRNLYCAVPILIYSTAHITTSLILIPWLPALAELLMGAHKHYKE